MEQKVKTEIQRSDYQHPLASLASQSLRQAAAAVNPQGFEYQGTFTVHLYASKDQKFIFLCHTIGIEFIPEREADAAFKELKTTLMAAYGRVEPKRRIV